MYAKAQPFFSLHIHNSDNWTDQSPNWAESHYAEEKTLLA